MAVWALIGFMGCGKSSIGRTVQRLAAASPVENIDFPVVDTNSRPTVSGTPISPIVDTNSRPTVSGTLISPVVDTNSSPTVSGTPISPVVDTNSRPTVSGELIFVDLDEEIVRREGRSIREIFAEGGEAAFRAIERDTLEELLTAGGLPLEGRNTRGSIAGGPSATADGGVSEANSRKRKAHLPSDILLSLGGGTLTDEGSRELVRKHCRCIYLRASLETLAANLRWEGETASRPMLAGADPKAPAESPDSLESRIATMMAERGPVYEKAADIIIDIDGLNYEDAARQIINSFFQ